MIHMPGGICERDADNQRKDISVNLPENIVRM